VALLEVTDLSVRFARKGERAVTAVDGVSFSIDAGEVVGLVGESGSGKTTISRSAGGLHKDWTGTISFEGREVSDPRIDRDVHHAGRGRRPGRAGPR